MDWKYGIDGILNGKSACCNVDKSSKYYSKLNHIV